VRLNRAGRVAEACWLAIPEHYPQVELDAYVVMPNHVHGIIRIAGEAVDGGVNDAHAAEGTGGADGGGAKNFSPLHEVLPTCRGIPPKGMGTFRSPSRTVGSIVRGFKIGVTNWFRSNTDRRDMWQRNYYEHIVRDARGMERIRRYIAENPARWGRGQLS
jgi:putative transposase